MTTVANTLKKLRVLSVGHVTHDRYGDDIVPGGCAFFGAVAAKVMGASVQFLTATGEDFLCQEALEGLDTHRIAQGLTTVFTNSYPHGGLRVQHVETQAPLITPEQLPARFRGPDLLFLAPVMGEIDPHDPWRERVTARFTALSLQGFMKEGEGGDSGKRVVVKKSTPLPDALFTGVDALFFSQEDLALFGAPGLLARLTAMVPHVFVTDGEEGCTIHQGSKKRHTGIFATTTVDPTGAGDTFAMGTSLGLAAGLSPHDAALLGAAAASVVVEEKGSLSLHRLTEAFARYETLLADA